MTDTALGLSPAHWSAIGAFIAVISLIYIIWWNHNRDKSDSDKSRSKKKVEKNISRLTVKKDKLEKKRLKVIKQEIHQLKKGKLRIVEDESRITKKKPHLQILGELSYGFRLEGTLQETLGGKFSYYLLDEASKDRNKRTGEIRSPIKSGTDKNKFNFKATVPRDNKYYILLTTRATKNPRNVHFRININTE